MTDPFQNLSNTDKLSFVQKTQDDVINMARLLDKPTDLVDNSLVFVEEYTLETERGQGRIYLTK